MPMMLRSDCPCCQRFIRGFIFIRGSDGWHCELCWNDYHNGIRDHDFLTEEEFKAKKEARRKK